MTKKIILLTILVILAASNCHYSCSNCTGKSYISCLKCSQNTSLKVVQNPSTIPRQYWSSLYPSGTCIETTSPQANGLGVFLFLFLTVTCLMIRTKQSFYLYLTIQTFGLYNLIQIGWVNPIGFVLQSMQYLMIWNVVGSGYKTADYTLIASKNYRLNRFLHQVQIGQNLAIIAAFTLISLALLIVICIISIRQKKQQQKKSQQELKNEEEGKNNVLYENILNQSEIDRNHAVVVGEQQQKPERCACWKAFTEDVLVQLAKLLIVFMFFMMQETMVVLLVSLVFIKPADSGIILLCIIYLHLLIFLMSYGYYYRIEYFKEKKTMYINFAKKIILPVMVVLPINNQYLIFVFAIAIFVLEFFIDYFNGLYQKFSRLVFYKIIQILIIVLLCVYYVVEVNARSASAPRAASLACTLAIAFYLACFVVVQLPLGIKEKYFDKKDSQSDNQVNDNNIITLEQINSKDGVDQKERNDVKVQFNGLKIESMSNQFQEEEEKEEEEQEEEEEQIDLGDNKGESNQNRESQKRASRDRAVQEMNGEHNAIFNQMEDISQQKDRNTAKDENNSMVTKNVPQNNQQQKQQAAQVSPAKKKKRKQIIDKQLRLRYGI